MPKAVHAARSGGRERAPATRLALWELGFRPFYLLASGFAALSIALWVAQYAGVLPGAYLRGPAWHGHEMIYGYAVAVITGFLFTAVRNWTGRPTPTGGWLMAACALWLAGRLLVVTPYGLLAALVNAAFPLAVAVGIALPLVQSGNRRNYFFVGLLVVLALADLAFHLSMLGVLDIPARPGLQAGLDVILFVMAVMGGRVIPMFTNNGVPGVQARRDERLERLALGAVLAVLMADVAGLGGAPMAGLLALATLLHGARLALWQPWRTLRTPLVWVLHAAYALIVLHLALRGLAQAGLIAASVATHALTGGAIGGLTMGMMTRTARGHTARPLRADRFDVAAYLCVVAAALLRVGVPLAAPALTVGASLFAGWLWACGFVLYAIRYAPFLLRARLDGKPG